MKNIIKKCNQVIRFLKFTSNNIYIYIYKRSLKSFFPKTSLEKKLCSVLKKKRKKKSCIRLHEPVC